MIPFAAMPRDELRDVVGVATDLDDTLTVHGTLTESSHAALHALSRAGIPCVIATGRALGWAEVLASLLPVAAVVAENGGSYCVREGRGVRAAFVEDEAERARQGAATEAVVRELSRRFPGLDPVRGYTLRATDAAMDLAERASVPAEVAREALAFARESGLHAVASSIHLHVSGRAPDKAEGLRAALAATGRDPAELASRWLYVGDSPNDQGAFAAIARSVGVRGVERFGLEHPPRYRTEGSSGEGFAEVVRALLEARS